jgi:alpha-beta hydrolase superfamily lysophospholipase
MDEFTFRDADAVEVFARRWLPAGTPRAVVLIAHGLSEHSGRYARFADALVGAGYAAYAVDHRGHGGTAESTGVGRAGPNGMDGILGDLHELSGIATSETATSEGDTSEGATSEGDGLPVVLFGHSMGALLAQAYAERFGDELTALVLSGSAGANDDLGEMAAMIRGAVDGGLGDEPMPMLAAMNEGFEPTRTPYDWLSRDQAEVDAYLADPMCGDDAPPTYGFIAAMMDTAVAAMQPDAIARIPTRVPVLLVTGERDVASSDAANVRVLEARLRAAGLDVDARYYADARHELLNEINRDEVTADIVSWLDAHI